MSEEKPFELSIRITATAQTPDASLQVSVSVKDLDLEKGPFPFSVPFDAAVLNDLRWYLELYPQWPVGRITIEHNRLKQTFVRGAKRCLMLCLLIPMRAVCTATFARKRTQIA